MLFLAAVALVVYTFIGYPLIIAQYAGPERPLTTPDADFAVTVIIAVYNGAASIERRMSDLLAQDYAPDRLSIIVVDDGSTDATWALLQQYAEVPNVQLLRAERNAGKAAALNLALAHAKTEIVFMTDVRQTFEADVLKRLTAHFTDPGVGAVTGNLVFRDGEDADPQGGYWDLEKSIRENESRYRSTVGVTGAIYAARRELIEPVPADLILDDVLIPMRIVRQGYRVKFEANAIAYDDKSKSLSEEYHRKVRTLAGNWQLIAQSPWLLSRRQNPILFEFLSHKVLRLLAPWALIVTMICAWLLSDIPLFMGIFWLQLALIGLAGIGFLTYALRIEIPLVSQLMGFALLNAAAIVGTLKFLFGRQRDLWKTH